MATPQLPLLLRKTGDGPNEHLIIDFTNFHCTFLGVVRWRSPKFISSELGAVCIDVMGDNAWSWGRVGNEDKSWGVFGRGVRGWQVYVSWRPQ